MAEELNREEVVEEAQEVTAPVETKKKKTSGKKSKGKKSDKRPPALVRLFTRFFRFLKDCKSEMGKVVWYGRKQTINSSIVVLVVMVVAGAAVILLDFGLSWLLNQIASWAPSL